MKITLVGSHICPNTLYAINKLKDAGVEFAFKDLSASLADLKYFLALHEHADVYASFREMSGNEDYLTAGKIGLPCYVFEDGTRTLDMAAAIEKAKS